MRELKPLILSKMLSQPYLGKRPDKVEGAFNYYLLHRIHWTVYRLDITLYFE